MSINQTNIGSMVYPGRVIIIGKNPEGRDVVMYAITGRSPSSQARKLEISNADKQIFVKPTDEETLKKGNPDLLVYPAIICGNAVAVSNGKQTENVFKGMDKGLNAIEILSKSLSCWEYEPDEPNYTPRISGCVANVSALSILKRAADGSVMRHFFEIPMIAGRGKLIATYTGVNQNPLPSFEGEPVDVEIPWLTADEAVGAFYELLGPEKSEPDFRVSAAVVFGTTENNLTMSVKNRNN